MSEYTAEMAHAAAARGAAWLDAHCLNWVNEIDVKSLNLLSTTSCVLGQTEVCLTGSTHPTKRPYQHVMAHFRVTDAWTVEHGFDVEMHVPGLGCDYNVCNGEAAARYEMLTIAWKELIRQRLEVRA